MIRRNYGKKRKLKKLFTAIVLTSALLYAGIVYFDKYKNHESGVIKINREVITKEEISKKVSEIFSSDSSQVAAPDFDSLPAEVIETFAKEIYLEKQLAKQAKKSGISKNEDVKYRIKQSEDRILIDAYLEDIISQKVNDEKIKEKYLELSTNLEGKREFSISHIVVKTEEEAKKVYKEFNETKAQKKANKFSDLAKKYSLDKESAKNGGKLGFILEDNMIKEIGEVVAKLKKSEFSKPIETKFGWHVVKVDDIKEAKILPFEEVQENIREQLIKDVTDEIYNEIFKNMKIKSLAKPKTSEEKSLDEKTQPTVEEGKIDGDVKAQDIVKDEDASKQKQ